MTTAIDHATKSAVEEIFTPEQVAERLHLDVQTVRKFLRERKIRGYLIGRVWRIPESSLQEWLDTMENRRPAPRPKA